MNSVSWFVYFINVIPSVGYTASWLVALAVIAYIISWIMRASAYDHHVDRRNEREKYETEIRPGFRKVHNWIVTVFTVSLLVTVFVPDRRTMIMIAASEIGEKVATSDRVTRIIDPSLELLKEWIEKELDEVKKARLPKEDKK